MNDGKKKQSKRRLAVGHIVKTPGHEWTVTELLGCGGFGDVYKVLRDGKDAFAMKIEFADKTAKKSSERLKIEWKMFVEIGKSDESKRQHIVSGIEKGMADGFKFIIMTLVSHSLEELHRVYFEDSFSTPTVYNTALQTLRAIEQLHEIGYLHRDIKPHNFAVGVPPKDSTIYMIDFGIAKRFVGKDGKLRIPRQSVRFLGTVQYASRACHNEKEQGRRDDLESWCYLVLDLFHPDNITWRRIKDSNKVAIYKHHLITRQGGREIKGPKEMYKIIAHINQLSYADTPDYDLIRSVLLEAARNEHCDLSTKFDWVGVELKRKVKKKTGPANRITDDSEETEKEKQKPKKRISLDNDDDSSESLPLAKPLVARRSFSKINLPPRHATPSIKGRVRQSANQPNSRLTTLTARAPPSAMRMPTTEGGGADTVASPVSTTATAMGTTGTGAAKSAYNVMTAIPRTPAPRQENSIGGLPREKKKPPPP